jgi:hypothetical protein
VIALYDTSVWVWSERDEGLRADLEDALLSDSVAICDPLKLELLYSARTGDEYRLLREELQALRQCPIGAAEWARALEVYDLLAAQGPLHQRQVKHVDLLAAVAAEAAGVPVMHYDQDFERIAAVTEQDVRWARPKGTLGR